MTRNIMTMNKTLLTLSLLTPLFSALDVDGATSPETLPVIVSTTNYKNKDRPFSEGLKPVELDGKWGFMNASGEYVIPCEYDYVRSFYDGLAMVKRGGKWGYIDWFGDLMIPIEYDEVSGFQDGHAFVKKDGIVGLINTRGDITFEYERMRPFTFPANWLDEAPLFNGAEANTFARWVNSMLRYPEMAKLYGTTGTVHLRFSIDVDGSVCDIKVKEGAGFMLNMEALRVLGESPKWTPGVYDGKPYKSFFKFPIIFRLRDSKSK